MHTSDCVVDFYQNVDFKQNFFWIRKCAVILLIKNRNIELYQLNIPAKSHEHSCMALTDSNELK